jgi:DNA-binding PadR family transcriptional regulator
MLDFAILGLLREQPRHGYELKRALGELGFWQVSFGSLYPALRRLEKRGAIVGARGSGRRRSYRLTPEGRAALAHMLEDPDDAEESERGFQLRLAFLGYLEPDLRIRVLEGRRSALVEGLLTARRSFLGARGSRTLDRYRLALMERRVHATEADIAWLDDLIAGERSNATGT